MTLRSLLRLVAGLALALFVALSWSTPSEAHAGHDKPVVATQKAHAELPAAPTAVTPTALAVAADPVAEAGPADCDGHMNRNGADNASCCSSTCHAAMSTDMAMFQTVTVAAAILPTLAAPAELSGPTMHLKRPPRPSAALVG